MEYVTPYPYRPHTYLVESGLCGEHNVNIEVSFQQDGIHVELGVFPWNQIEGIRAALQGEKDD